MHHCQVLRRLKDGGSNCRGDSTSIVNTGLWTKKANLTFHNELKVLHICLIHGIPIGGYTGVGTSVSIHGVNQGQVATDEEDITSSS